MLKSVKLLEMGARKARRGLWWTDGGCGRVWLALEPTLSTKYIEDQMATKEDKKESD